MFQYVTEKEFLHQAYRKAADLVNQTVQLLKKDGIHVSMKNVGSMSRNMVMTHGDGDIDFDFNLTVMKATVIDDGREVKRTVQKAFDQILTKYGLGHSKDSTSALSSGPISMKGYHTRFHIDICLIRTKGDRWYRLIHQKTGLIEMDRWAWEEGPHTEGLMRKVDYLKKKPKAWAEVRDNYINRKNRYLRQQNYDHHSFNCLI